MALQKWYQGNLSLERKQEESFQMKKRLGVIFVLVMTVFIGFGVIIPILPEVLPPRHLGWLLALYSLASFVMSPLWGALSDRIGRKPVIMIGALGFSVSFFLFGMFLDTLWVLYVSRILGGLFSGAVTSCAMAYVADSTDEEHRTRSMGMIGMAIGFGFIIGPAVGGLLSVISYQIPFFVASSLALVTMFFTFTALEESLDPEQRRLLAASQDNTSRWKAFSGPLKYLYLLSFFVSFTLAGLESTLLYFLKTIFPMTTRDFGILLLINGLAGALVQGGVVRRFVHKGRENAVIHIGLALSAAGFFLLLVTTGFATATLYVCVFGVGNALIRPCVLSLITQKTTVGQGVATGLSSSMDSLGRIVGPLFGTYLFTAGPSIPFVANGILCIAAFGLLYGFIIQDRKRAAELV
jgi:multidrug resistance protein